MAFTLTTISSSWASFASSLPSFCSQGSDCLHLLSSHSFSVLPLTLITVILILIHLLQFQDTSNQIRERVVICTRRLNHNTLVSQLCQSWNILTTISLSWDHQSPRVLQIESVCDQISYMTENCNVEVKMLRPKRGKRYKYLEWLLSWDFGIRLFSVSFRNSSSVVFSLGQKGWKRDIKISGGSLVTSRGSILKMDKMITEHTCQPFVENSWLHRCSRHFYTRDWFGWNMTSGKGLESLPRADFQSYTICMNSYDFQESKTCRI